MKKIEWIHCPACGSTRGATASAGIDTLIEKAKANGTSSGIEYKVIDKLEVSSAQSNAIQAAYCNHPIRNKCNG